MACDPYKKDPIVRMLWKTFRAVPVLPIEPSLAVFSVLLKERRGFRLIGDLGTLCAQGQAKEDLVRIISGQDPAHMTRLQEHGAIETTVKNDISWSIKLLGLASLGMSKEHMCKIDVPSYQARTLPLESVDRVLELFKPDSRNLYLAKHYERGVNLWIVTDVIEAPLLEVKAMDSRGGNVGAAVPAGVVPLPVQVDVSVGVTVGGDTMYRIRGPNECPLPVAFRGYKCRYENGKLKTYKPSKIQPDGAGDAISNAGESSGQQAQAHDDPYNDHHMGDFLADDTWFASFVQD